MKNQPSFFDNMRMMLDDAIGVSVASLVEYGQRYRHWAIAYSGGKDSTATVAFVAWSIRAGLVPPPQTVTVLYADTRMELPPLQQSAVQLLSTLSTQGVSTQIVLPRMDDRFYVYMLGRGVPPPSNTFRWCTPQLKIEPMHAALSTLRYNYGEKLLMLTGVRLGESAARDQRIALSCSRDSGECGQGWFQTSTPESIADTLAPLLHWRLCHIYDWLYFENDRHGYDVTAIAAIYGEDDVRTGCVGCNLASRDSDLERLLRQPAWSHLSPLLELRPLYAELKLAANRLRKTEPEMRKDGRYATNVQRLGPLTMEARHYALDRLLDIQHRAGVDLINDAEQKRILELIAANTWPNRWTGTELNGAEPINALVLDAFGELVTQPWIF